MKIAYAKQYQGSLRAGYEIYLSASDDGDGFDIITGYALLTFEEWLAQ